MDQEACLFPADDGNLDDVDLTAVPTSAEAYIRQMRAERRAQPAVVTVQTAKKSKKISMSTSPEAKKARQLWYENNGVVVHKEKAKETPSSLIPPEEWQMSKSKQFSEFRKKLMPKTAEPLTKIKALKTSEKELWHEMLFEKCLPEFESHVAQFSNHTGTPPALPMVLAIPKSFHTQLIENLAEWAAEEGFSRPIREWLYAILLVIEWPLVPEAVSALRTIANQCKNLRSQLSEDRKEEAFEYSLFIAIIGIYFVQKDLADNFKF